MIPKTVIDLLSEEDIELPSDKPPRSIDNIFMPNRQDGEPTNSESHVGSRISTRKRLDILGWASIDRQLRSYGSNRIDDLSMGLVNEDAREHITGGESDGVFDFRSDSAPFAVKYNIAIALSYSEAINLLSHQKTCEIYYSPEIARVFAKYGKRINPGLSRINFGELPMGMKRELVWPMVQNLYRALMVRKAARVFPEGVSGETAYKALISKFEDELLIGQISPIEVVKYSNYETVYFSDPSDLEIKYQVAVYCLNHVGEIKASQKSDQEIPPQEEKPEEEEKSKDEQEQSDENKQAENFRKLEEEYIAAFKRLNKDKSFWDRINLGDILEMGKDVISAIREEIRDFAILKQEIIYRLGGRTKLAIENEELLRIVQNQNPDFDFASKYLSMFFQPRDYYSILGIEATDSVTEKDIKDAFKRQAKIYHPDKNSNDPNKDEKESRFKMLIAAKNALLKKLSSDEGTPTSFRDDVSVTRYLGSISSLFGEFRSAEQSAVHQAERTEVKVINNEYQSQEDAGPDQQDQEGVGMETEDNVVQNSASKEEYLGPYFEEMRVLKSMIDGWAGKEVLILGVGRQAEEFSMPVILTQMGARVSALDINYQGPSEYKGCQYYRASVDMAEAMFLEEQFDIVISTAMFGVPFTNWAAREYSLNTSGGSFKDRIKELELEAFGKLLKLTKKGGVHLHYNKDLNPQSWNFTESDLKQLGYESASQSQELISSRETWFLKK